MTLRDKLPELAVEAVMVVFAVTAALAADAWRENRQMQEFAERAREAVMVEARANLETFENTGPALDTMQAMLAEVLRRPDPGNSSLDLDFELPEASTAAWRAAQTSQAAAYLDYDWVVEVGRTYEVVEAYEAVSTGLIDAMGGIIASSIGASLDPATLRTVFGRLTVLTDIHGQAEDRLRDIVAAEGSADR